MESSPSKYDLAAYVEQHLLLANRSALKLAGMYGDDFNSFLYRPDLDHFIKHEILHQLYPTWENVTFLDNDHWNDRHPFNFPGPFYTGISDTCATGDSEAPENVLYDAHTHEFVFRQPSSYLELVCVIDAGAVEIFDSYSSNGNAHWTYQRCKEWWDARFEMIINLNDPEVERTNGKGRVIRYISYLDSEAETNLRRYSYFLENGRYPDFESVLPIL